MKLNDNFLAQMREANRLLQADGPLAATAAIQRALHGADMPEAQASQREAGVDSGDTMPHAPYMGKMIDINPPFATEPNADTNTGAAARGSISDRLAKLMRGKWKGASARQPVQDVELDAELAGKGRYLAGSVSCKAGTRAYKLYIPSGYTGEAGQALPLMVMLHGCKQNPDDFAAGTGMNAVAEEQNCFVVYPGQVHAANGSNCWNWFKPEDQRRDRGEPAIIAAITQEIMRDYKIDANRIYVAGLSAGGAMAAVLGATYPDLFAAIGIHSGLPYGAAHDVPSAFAAMSSGGAKAAGPLAGSKAPASLGHAIPVIVFHGDRDTTVHPANGDKALEQCLPEGAAHAANATSAKAGTASGTGGARLKTEKGKTPNGRSYTRTVRQDAGGKVIAEQWLVHGAGHAWAGGSKKGSYTDPNGPSATREMLRFFYSQTRATR